ncbi:lambda exonuclease family protein [Aureimonas sp. AU20]|uniref:lambda exonuclease family protein n=1 Tax=Aureimonas sp. AU20 TaxID=1349819 RepID=UPI000722E92D|nr:lambda exonuclease family protein [Aureimonas sp. AU20]ALN73563.1 hypothetical protein M673_12615 [Aureimonas sp. AU20]
MSPQVFDMEQGGPEWFAARAGIPTASMFATVLAKGKGDTASKTRRTYMLKLAGEILTGEPMESYTNAHMERGRSMEDDARRAYAFMADADPDLVGFIRSGQKGCSPDSLLGADGLLEIKTKLPHILIDVLLRGEIPPEHIAQCQGQLWVAEREWVDFVAYWPGLPLFVKRAYRDEAYIADLSKAVDLFNDQLADMVAQVKAFEPPQAVAA